MIDLSGQRRLLFLALARDCEENLPRFVDLFDQLRAADISVDAYIGENGSTDGTRAILEYAAANRPGFSVVDTSAMASIPSRLHRMAVGRDIVAAAAHDLASSDGFVAVIDLDTVLAAPPSPTAFIDSMDNLEVKPELAGISASSEPYYYDILAFRGKGVLEWNLQPALDQARRNPIAYYLVHRQIYAAQRKITKRVGLICQSAFNGACVYRSRDYFAQTYTEVLRPDVCEHVPFNEALCARGDRGILVSPQLRLAMPAEHGPVGPMAFYLDRLRKLLRGYKGR